MITLPKAYKPLKPGKSLNLFKELAKNRALYLMIVPSFVVLFVFAYIPMYGVQVAFRNFNSYDGITGSPWVGLDNFMFFFKSIFFFRLTFNTLFLNILFLAAGLFMQLSTAILINEVINRRYKKFLQTAMFFPYFLSWIVVSTLVNALLSDSYGLLNKLLNMIGLEGVVWYKAPGYWPAILTIASVWKGMGYGVVIYMAKIAGIDQEIYDASSIDGANKAQEIFYITLPMLVPTVVLLVLLGIGNMFRGDFGMIYQLTGDGGVLQATTDVIDTFVFRAMRVQGQYGLSAAIGLYQSIMGLIMVLATNWFIRRYDSDMAIF
jgi:putative aldouronate transport system permease protein